MRPRGCLLGVLGVLVGIALVATLVDAGARHYATSRVEARIRTAAPESRGVKARIHSWPFLKLAINGHVDEVGAHVVQLVEKPLVFSDVDVDLRGVRVDQGTLASEGRLVISHIDAGNVTMSVTAGDLAAAAGVPVALADAAAGVGSRTVRVRVDAAKRQLVVDVLGLKAFAFALPGVDLLPCIPAVAMGAARLTLSCSFTAVPSAFAAIASG